METTWESRPELPDGAPPPPELPADDGRPPWPPWMGIAAIPLAFIVAAIAAFVVVIGTGNAGTGVDDMPAGVNLAALVLQGVVFIGVALVLARLGGRARPADFGLRVPAWLPALGWTALLFVAFLFIAGMIALAFGVGDADQPDLNDQLNVRDGSVGVVVAALLVCVGAPITEEFLFRGFIFGALRNFAPGVTGLSIGAIGSGVLFGGIHFANYDGSEVDVLLASVLTLMVLGIGLALLAWKTGSILPCIALHAINNSIAFGSQQDWDWQIVPVALGSLALCAVVVALMLRFWRPAASMASA